MTTPIGGDVLEKLYEKYPNLRTKSSIVVLGFFNDIKAQFDTIGLKPAVTTREFVQYNVTSNRQKFSVILNNSKPVRIHVTKGHV